MEKKFIIKIERQDIAYFIYLSYEVEGCDVLLKIIKDKRERCAIIKKRDDLILEREILMHELINKYGFDEYLTKYSMYSFSGNLNKNEIEIKFYNQKEVNHG